MTTTTSTFAAAALATIKTFLADSNADAGLASAMKYDGWRIAEVRAYADRVQALRAAGFTAAIAPRTVDAAEQQVAAERAAAEASKASKATTEPRAGRSQANERAVELMLALGIVDAAAFTACTGKNAKTYLCASGWTTAINGGQPATWNPIFTACVRMGVQAAFAKLNGEAQLVLCKLTDEAAEAQRAELAQGTAQYAAQKADRKAAA